jgi:hypothetical protein
MAKIENDKNLFDDLKSLGWHIPDTCIDFKIYSPLDSPIIVHCKYFLYKDELKDVDWDKAREAAKYENEMVNNLTKEESFLEGVRWALKQLNKDKC